MLFAVCYHAQVIKEPDGPVTTYNKLWVMDPESNKKVLVYVDTSEQGLLYDPQTFQGDYKSNYSGIIGQLIVMRLLKTNNFMHMHR